MKSQHRSSINGRVSQMNTSITGWNKDRPISNFDLPPDPEITKTLIINEGVKSPHDLPKIKVKKQGSDKKPAGYQQENLSYRTIYQSIDTSIHEQDELLRKAKKEQKDLENKKMLQQKEIENKMKANMKVGNPNS